MTDLPLQRRADALARAVVLSRGRYPDEVVNNAAVTVTKAHERLRHGSHHTVVALVGPTGSGKSSLFNALAGDTVSDTGVRRPTTSETHSVAWADDASALLDWLEIRRRHNAPANPSLEGLVLLDLPDFDSTEATNRIEVDRLVQLVDLLIWVVEPQKYADQALHQGYIEPLSGHASVMRFVLSKSDLLSPEQLAQTVPDMIRLLAEDGVEDPVVIPLSVQTSDGIDDLWSTLAAAANDRQVMVQRLSADIREAALGIGAGAGDNRRASVAKGDRKELIRGLGNAAGVDAAADVVARQHRRDAALATGWPPTRWARRLRRTPLSELPMPGKSAVAQAEIGSALRQVGEATAENLGNPWESTVRRTSLDQGDAVQAELAKITTHAARAQRDKPGWWAAAKWLQRLFGLVAAAGAVWLIVLAVVGGILRLDTDALTPMVWDWMPLPTLLLLAGALLGILLALLARIPANVGANRRARRARKMLDKEVALVAEEHVVAPIEDALAQRQELTEVLTVAANG